MKRAILYGGAGLVAVLGVYLLAVRKPGDSAGATLGRLAVGTIADAGVGAIKGVGSIFGIPDTSTSQCEKDRASGDRWAASFSCPATDFIGSVFNSSNIRWAEQSDAAAYQQAVAATRADTDWNPFTNNPNNVSPSDLIPSGYKMNQWGGLEPVSSGGATGIW